MYVCMYDRQELRKNRNGAISPDLQAPRQSYCTVPELLKHCCEVLVPAGSQLHNLFLRPLLIGMPRNGSRRAKTVR